MQTRSFGFFTNCMSETGDVGPHRSPLTLWLHQSKKMPELRMHACMHAASDRSILCPQPDLIGPEECSKTAEKLNTSTHSTCRASGSVKVSTFCTCHDKPCLTLETDPCQ